MNNTLIVYASRHGTTAEYAKKMFQILEGNVDLCFLNEREHSIPDLTELRTAYPKELIETAVVSDYFDGELLFPKMNFWERMVAKTVLKAEEMKPLLSKPKITNFVDKLNQ